jgi:hypothetical protein
VATTPPWQLLPDVRRGLRLSSACPLRGPDFIDSVKGSQNALPRCQSDYRIRSTSSAHCRRWNTC